MMIQWNKSIIGHELLTKNIFILSRNRCSSHITYILKAKEAVDVGTGCGIPGIIMALLHPEMHWHLIDAKEKRIIFLKM